MTTESSTSGASGGVRPSVESGLNLEVPSEETLLLAGAHRTVGSAIAILTSRPRGLISTWNRGAKRSLSFDEDEVLGNHFSMLYPTHDVHDGLPELHLDQAMTLGHCNVEQWLVRRDGSRMWTDVDITCLRDSSETLKGFVLVAKDLTRHRKTEDELTHLALHDALTGLPNRRLLVDRANQAIERQGRHGTTVALMVFDLDDFKVVNDTFGHRVGDRILTQVAQRMQRALRPGDTVGRFGGDEFVVLCEDLPDSEQAEVIARRLIRAVRRPVSVGSGRVRITATAGVVLSPASDDDFDSLVQYADAAMYRAKATGGDDVEIIRVSHPG